MLRFEPGVGGRLVESYEDGSEFAVGEIAVWEPGRRITMSWRISNFAPGEETEVEVCFEATSNGTEVLVVHRGWDGLRPDHPARHGLEGRDFFMLRGGWWSELVGAYRSHTLVST